jgi:hypothetical protein
MTRVPPGMWHMKAIVRMAKFENSKKKTLTVASNSSSISPPSPFLRDALFPLALSVDLVDVDVDVDRDDFVR